MEILRRRFAGGQGVPPLSAALYLKRVEGEARDGMAIVPASVSARTHEITGLKTFRDEGFLRTGYTDIEDYGQMHVDVFRRHSGGHLLHRSWCWGASTVGSKFLPTTIARGAI